MTSPSGKLKDQFASALKSGVNAVKRGDMKFRASVENADEESSDGFEYDDDDDGVPQPDKRRRTSPSLADESECSEDLREFAESFGIDDTATPVDEDDAEAGSVYTDSVNQLPDVSEEESEDIAVQHAPTMQRIKTALGKKVDESQLSVTQQFKNWLGVNPGAHLAELEREVRASDAELGDSMVRKIARAKLAEEDKAKNKSAYEREVDDEKACRLLIRAYIETDDKHALSIYMRFMRECARFTHGLDAKRIALRMTNIERSVETCKAHVRNGRQTIEAVIDCLGESPDPAEVARESQITAASMQTNTLAREEPQPGAVKTVADFVAAYSADVTLSSSQVQARHCESLAADLVSALNLTAALVSVAPDDATIFRTGELDAPHPVDAMRRIMRGAIPDEQLDERTISDYMRLWSQTQSESPADVDRALAEVYRGQELEAIVRDMATRGVESDQVDTMVAYGMDPSRSSMMRAVMAFVDDEDFNEAHQAAVESSKLKARHDEHDRKVRRDASSGSTSDAADDVSLDDYDIDRDNSKRRGFYSAAARQLETCSRSYIADFLRAPAGPQYAERECVNGIKCICTSLSVPFPTLGSNLGGHAARNVAGNGSAGVGASLERDNGEPIAAHGEDGSSSSKAPPNIVGRHRHGFVCREFLKPSQNATLQSTGKLPPIIQPCVLCSRYATSTLYHRYMQQRGPGDPVMPIDLLHDHAVIINQDGEYSPSVCLLTTFPDRPFTGIVKPFPGFNGNHYRYAKTTAHGVDLPCVVETSVMDFRLASGGATRI